jgi:hypothetical protein
LLDGTYLVIKEGIIAEFRENPKVSNRAVLIKTDSCFIDTILGKKLEPKRRANKQITCPASNKVLSRNTFVRILKRDLDK